MLLEYGDIKCQSKSTRDLVDGDVYKLTKTKVEEQLALSVL